MPKTEAVVQRCSVKKLFLEISQNLRENNCARVSFLINLQASTLSPPAFFQTKQIIFVSYSVTVCKIQTNVAERIHLENLVYLG